MFSSLTASVVWEVFLIKSCNVKILDYNYIRFILYIHKNMFGLTQLMRDIQKLKELIEIWDQKYKALKEENERLKDELGQAYDFIDRYVYKNKKIKF